MKAPIKSGTEASKTTEGGALGNIDEQRGHPGKGTGDTAIKPEHSGSDAEDGGGEDKDEANAPPDPQGGSM